MKQYEVYGDCQLLQLIREDDRVAYTELFNRYWKTLYFSARKKLADEEQAKDIVSDVLLSIWERRMELDIQFLPAYLEQAVRFKVINFVNRRKIPAFFDLIDDVLYSPYDADLKIREEEARKLVDYFLETLPPTRREIVRKYYYESMSVDKIALDLDLSVKTVRNNLSLAFKQFRSLRGKLTITLLLILFQVL